MEMKTTHGKGIGGAVARIAAEIRDYRMAPDTLRKEVSARYAGEIAKGKEGYGKRLGDVGYDARWSGPYGLTRAATKAVEREVLEQVIREQVRCTPPESCLLSRADPVPMQISSGVREFRLEKVLSEKAAMALRLMLMRRLKAVTIDVKACIEGGHYYKFATSPYWKKLSPHREEIETARELLHLAKARGWGAERLEAEEKLAESIERSKEWRREGLRRFLGS